MGRKHHKGYNIFKASGFKNLRQVLGMAGKSKIAKTANQAAINKINSYSARRGGKVRRHRR